MKRPLGTRRSLGTCPRCGKQSYATRKDARRAGRALHPNAHLSAYRCGHEWHYGNLPTPVLDGRLTRNDLTPKTKRPER